MAEGSDFDRPELLALSDRLRRQSEKIAELDFRAMLDQLGDGRFYYETDAPPDSPAPPGRIAPSLAPRGVRIVPPVGSVAAAGGGDPPTIGIAIDIAPRDRLAQSLTSLFWQHHAAPLGRLVFVTELLPLLPFLGRFGFAYWVAPPDPQAFDAIARRFGVTQVRRLSDAAICWTARGAKPDVVGLTHDNRP